MLLRELFVNPKKPLLEGGGNIWPETTPFYPTPDMVQALVKEVQGYLHDAGFPIHVQGSGSNEDPDPEHPTGDLDVSVDIDQVKQFFKIPAGKSLADDDKAARNALEKFLLDNGVAATYKAGVTVHIKFPYDCSALVAHNLAFDKPVLVAEFLRLSRNISLPPILYCTMDSTKALCKIPAKTNFPKASDPYKWPSLNELYIFLFGNNDGMKYHTADGDVHCLVLCFNELVRRRLVPLEEWALRVTEG